MSSESPLTDFTLTLGYYLSGHGSQVTAFCYTDMGNYLLSGDESGLIKVWDSHSCNCIKEFRAHDKTRIISILDAHNEGFVSYGKDNTLKLWYSVRDVSEPELVLETGTSLFCNASIVVTKYDKVFVAFPGSNGGIDVYNLTGRESVSTRMGAETSFHTQRDSLACLSIFAKSNTNCTIFVASGYESGTISIWNAQEKQLIWTKKVFTEPVTCLSNVSYDETLMCGNADSIIARIDNAGYDPVYTFARLSNSGIGSVLIAPDNKICYVLLWDGRFCALEIRDMKILLTSKKCNDFISCIDSRRIAFDNLNQKSCDLVCTASKNEGIKIWVLAQVRSSLPCALKD